MIKKEFVLLVKKIFVILLHASAAPGSIHVTAAKLPPPGTLFIHKKSLLLCFLPE